jgi:predicted solute-binding protein/2-iminoacetate synthase ThiH
MSFSQIKTYNIHYLNSIPYRVLRNDPNLLYKEGFPVECASALLQKDADLALLPIASIFKHGLYEILEYGVVANGPVESVFLLSKLPLEELNEIVVDVSSETSIILLKTILAEFYPHVNSRVTFRFESPKSVIDAIEGQVGGLIIGDDGLKNASKFDCTMDLADEWKKQTGSPFLFAAWAHRPNTLSTKQIDAFNQNVEVGLKHRALYARDWADTQGISREEAMRYVGEVISYPITSDVKEAAVEFIGRAAKHNLLPKEFVDSEGSFSANLSTKKSVLKDTSIIEEALKGRRLSIGSAQYLVEQLPLSKLAKLTADARPSSGKVSLPIYHLNLEDEGQIISTVGSRKLLSPNQIVQKLENIPEFSTVVVESLGFNELTLEYFQELIELINNTKRLKLAMLSVPELSRISSDTSMSIEEILEDFESRGLSYVAGITEYLLCDQERTNPLEYLRCQRLIAKSGLQTISNLRVSGELSLLEYAIHLFQLRQLQDQTGSIAGHFIDSCPTNSKVFSEFHTPGHYFQVICLARLILDNVSNIAISPRVFGRPVAELLSALGPAQDQGDESLLRII